MYYIGKELLEVHFDGNSLIMNDYKSLKGYGLIINEINTKTSQKGQAEQLEDIYLFLTGKTNKYPISLTDLFQTSECTFLLS